MRAERSEGPLSILTLGLDRESSQSVSGQPEVALQAHEVVIVSAGQDERREPLTAQQCTGELSKPLV